MTDRDGSNRLRLMTFNLRTAAAADEYTWERRWPVVQKVLAAEKPDLIGTQEGLLNQLTDLENGFPEYGWIGIGREGGLAGEFMAVYYNKGRLKPLSENHFWLSDTPDVPGSTSWGNRITRMVTWVLFEDAATGGSFYLVNTHFDHQSDYARKRSAALLAQTVNEFDSSVPVFVTGDFNCEIGSEPYRIVTEASGLKDAVQDAADRVGFELGTFHDYKGGRGPNIDWILYRGEVEIVRSEKIAFHLNGEYPSDHYPVTADVAFKGNI